MRNHRKKWTSVETRIALNMWEDGKTAREIGESMGRTHGGIRRILYQHGVLRRRLDRPVANIPMIRELAIARRRKNLTLESVARKIGGDRSAVARWEEGQTNPKLFSFICWANSLGYELTLTPK